MPMLLSIRVPKENERGPRYCEEALKVIGEACGERRTSFELLWAQNGEEALLGLDLPKGLESIGRIQLIAQYRDATITECESTLPEPTEGMTGSRLWLALTPDCFPLRCSIEQGDPTSRSFADPVTTLLHAVQSSPKRQMQSVIRLRLRPATVRERRRYLTLVRRQSHSFFQRHPHLGSLQLRLSLATWWHRWVATLLSIPAWKGEGRAQERVLTTSSTRERDRQDDLESASHKLHQMLFSATLEIAVSGPPEAGKQVRSKASEIASAFSVWNGRRAKFHRSRHPKRFLLSAEEAASLWHPPTTGVAADNHQSVTHRLLPPPLNLPTTRRRTDVTTLGVTAYHDVHKKFGIEPEARFRHMALLGKTGVGKSTLLSRMIVSDIQKGYGVGVVDPHGDLVETVLSHVPKERTNDVVLFDPSDLAHPFSFNLLDCSDPERRPLIASGIVSAFKKLFGDSWGPRMEHYLRAALLALLEVKGTNMLSLASFLNDGRYRSEILHRVRDPIVHDVWEKEFASKPKRLQEEMLAPIQNKLSAMLSYRHFRNVIGQSRNKLKFREILDTQKILLCSFSKGKLGEDVAQLLGSLTITALQIAAMSRAELPAEKRVDFFQTIDEFQAFTTDSFSAFFSEMRKYRVALTVANQHLSQLSDATREALLGNAQTLCAFQVGPLDSELIAQALGGSVTPEDLVRIPQFHAYMRLLIDGEPSLPFTLRTLPLGTPHRPRQVERIRERSRRSYCRARGEVEEWTSVLSPRAQLS